MITAMPTDGNKLAGHFKKAPQFTIFAADGSQLVQFDNPASSGCSGRSELMAKFTEYQVQRVLVRNIGERMLGKLLSEKLSVFKTSNGRAKLELLAQSANEELTPLIYPSQGRKSINHRIKQANGGGCSGHDHGAEGHGCCGHDGSSDQPKSCQTTGIRCCEKQDKPAAPKLSLGGFKATTAAPMTGFKLNK
ncbi:NifB/NifX family molybdenum-iron cluster-binding protein [Ferrimonas senticii]|uniref:NifB/NifX family molybdenum-iron cluster-binding protein n=1 Tax=Ferrimonas senticii TaxID=394566 RepID=UPI000416BFC9|nr:NifB/NifX family molybdenum-iron cluster-binding protein [Ferrimonas senticii]